jgi:hypothetical protein
MRGSAMPHIAYLLGAPRPGRGRDGDRDYNREDIARGTYQVHCPSMT